MPKSMTLMQATRSLEGQEQVSRLDARIAVNNLAA
jgi:hypothetical protein